MGELQCEKAVCMRCEQGQGDQEDFRNTTCVMLNKVQRELRLRQNVKGNKSSFCFYDSNERSNRENISLLLNWAGDLVLEDTDDAGGLNTSFV